MPPLCATPFRLVFAFPRCLTHAPHCCRTCPTDSTQVPKHRALPPLARYSSTLALHDEFFLPASLHRSPSHVPRGKLSQGSICPRRPARFALSPLTCNLLTKPVVASPPLLSVLVLPGELMTQLRGRDDDDGPTQKHSATGPRSHMGVMAAVTMS